MNLNEVLHHLARTKLGWVESTIFSENGKFTIKSNDGEIVTEKDFTKEEISVAKTEVENSLKIQQEEILRKKNLLLEKLGITEEEAQLLLS